MEMVAEDFQDIARLHLRRYPGMQPRDLYKLALQAAQGSEHAAVAEEDARRRLQAELSTLGEDTGDGNEPLFDPVSPDGRHVRVHLRPFLLSGRDADLLLQAFLHSTRQPSGSRARMRAYLGSILELLDGRGLPLDRQSVQAFFDEMETLGFPSVHHSDAYNRLYRPAYRLVLAERLKELA